LVGEVERLPEAKLFGILEAESEPLISLAEIADVDDFHGDTLVPVAKNGRLLDIRHLLLETTWHLPFAELPHPITQRFGIPE
jgi:hypothetical protein